MLVFHESKETVLIGQLQGNSVGLDFYLQKEIVCNINFWLINQNISVIFMYLFFQVMGSQWSILNPFIVVCFILTKST